MKRLTYIHVKSNATFKPVDNNQNQSHSLK